MDTQSKKDKALITKHLKGTCRGIALKIIKAILCCIAEALYLHTINKAVLGIIFVRLALFRDTLLVPSRLFPSLGLNVQCDFTRSVNLAWLTVPITAACSCLFGFVWLGKWSLLQLPSGEHVYDYKHAVAVIGLACIIESCGVVARLLTTPAPYSHCRYLSKLRYFIDTGVVIVTAIYFPECTIKAYSYGNLVYAAIDCAVLWAVFFIEFGRKAQPGKQVNTSQLPSSRRLTDYLPKNVFSSNYLQGIKLSTGLQELYKEDAFYDIARNLDLYAMTVFRTVGFAEQGIYVAVRRLSFRVIECFRSSLNMESWFCYCRTVSPAMIHDVEAEYPSHLERLSKCFFVFMRASAHIACIAFTFWLAYSHVFSLAFAGSLLANRPASLLVKAFSLIALLEGLVTESCATFLMRDSEFNSYNESRRLLICFNWLACGLLGYFIGAFAFVVGHCCQLTVEILYGAWILRREYKDLPAKPYLALVPKKTELLALSVVLAVTLTSESFIYPHSVGLHLAVGICSAVVLEAIGITKLRYWWGIVSSVPSRIFLRAIW